ncbi:MAG: hypothetical protein PUD09_04400, partial [Coriobacteriales bacterium]|nr:hypothetical protein [Coriobacteriales bacterium]
SIEIIVATSTSLYFKKNNACTCCVILTCGYRSINNMQALLACKRFSLGPSPRELLSAKS